MSKVNFVRMQKNECIKSASVWIVWCYHFKRIQSTPHVAQLLFVFFYIACKSKYEFKTVALLSNGMQWWIQTRNSIENEIECDDFHRNIIVGTAKISIFPSWHIHKFMHHFYQRSIYIWVQRWQGNNYRHDSSLARKKTCVWKPSRRQTFTRQTMVPM